GPAEHEIERGRLADRPIGGAQVDAELLQDLTLHLRDRDAEHDLVLALDGQRVDDLATARRTATHADADAAARGRGAAAPAALADEGARDVSGLLRLGSGVHHAGHQDGVARRLHLERAPGRA